MRHLHQLAMIISFLSPLLLLFRLRVLFVLSFLLPPLFNFYHLSLRCPPSHITLCHIVRSLTINFDIFDVSVKIYKNLAMRQPRMALEIGAVAEGNPMTEAERTVRWLTL